MANELVTWSDDFLVGNSTIDTQHKELVRLTNEFYAGVQMGGVLAKVYFLQTIKGAVQYVKTHFSDEEALMLKAEYPEFMEHKKQHEDFVVEVTNQVRNFENDDNPDPAKFVKYLMDWILHHIAASDKKYSPYLSKLES
ncbi:MAG: bacteriohemerythrin [Treponema sp.]|nr:bacteriohemerythrin [Treponema sp.]